MGGENWPTSARKPSKSVAALILSIMGALGWYFFQNKGASTLVSAHICWAFVVSHKSLFLFNKFLNLLFYCLAACESRLAFIQSFSSRFVVRQSTSNQGLWQCFFLQLPPKGLLPKVNFATAPTHCFSRSANSFAPRCPIESTAHRFPRLAVRAS